MKMTLYIIMDHNLWYTLLWYRSEKSFIEINSMATNNELWDALD